MCYLVMRIAAICNKLGKKDFGPLSSKDLVLKDFRRKLSIFPVQYFLVLKALQRSYHRKPQAHDCLPAL